MDSIYVSGPISENVRKLAAAQDGFGPTGCKPRLLPCSWFALAWHRHGKWGPVPVFFKTGCVAVQPLPGLTKVVPHLSPLPALEIRC
jgi:hypothetical protein